jgi:hypothetical protein
MDLQAVFDKLNDRYFDGSLRASIHWGRGAAPKADLKFFVWGLCYYEERRITMNPLLRHPKIPRYYAELWIYHEMLHITHPPIKVRGRLEYHHERFLAEERKFYFYKAARAWETQQKLNWLLKKDSRLTALPR